MIDLIMSIIDMDNNCAIDGTILQLKSSRPQDTASRIPFFSLSDVLINVLDRREKQLLIFSVVAWFVAMLEFFWRWCCAQRAGDGLLSGTGSLMNNL